MNDHCRAYGRFHKCEHGDNILKKTVNTVDFISQYADNNKAYCKINDNINNSG